MNIVSWVLNRIRNFGVRFSATFGNAYRVMYAGTIVKMNYTNYKHDPSPLIFVLYSGIKYTDGLNLNYLNHQEKQYLGRLIYALKRGNQVINGRSLYLVLKRDVYYSIVRKCYRKYFSNMIAKSSFKLRFPRMNSFRCVGCIPIIVAKSFCLIPRSSNSSRKISPGCIALTGTFTRLIQFR